MDALMKATDKPLIIINESMQFSAGVNLNYVMEFVKKRDLTPKRKISPGRKVFMKYQIQEWIDNRRSDWERSSHLNNRSKNS